MCAQVQNSSPVSNNCGFTCQWAPTSTVAELMFPQKGKLQIWTLCLIIVRDLTTSVPGWKGKLHVELKFLQYKRGRGSEVH
jgi:hypothetical protein